MLSFRIHVNGEVVKWALTYGESKDISRMKKKYGKRIRHWEDPKSKSDYPTFSQLCDFSNSMRVPFNCFLNKSLPRMPKVYAGFRTVNNRQPMSLQLIDVLDMMKSRQSWMRNYILSLDTHFHFNYSHFISSKMSVSFAAHKVSKLLCIDRIRDATPGISDNSVRIFFNTLRSKISNLGIIVMQNGVDGKNTGRKLSVKSFRAFALFDRIIPLIFINNSDSNRAKIFSLVHEVIHILLGNNEILNVSIEKGNRYSGERWINDVTASVLLPLQIVLNNDRGLPIDIVRNISNITYISQLAVAIRLKYLNIPGITQSLINRIKRGIYLNMKIIIQNKEYSGGNYYNNVVSRIDSHFANAVVNSAAEGHITLGKAASMLDVSLRSYKVAVDHILK